MHIIRNVITAALASGLLLGCAAELDLPHCGDGIVDEGEVCDDGEDNSDTTADACRRTCVLPWCGDGVLDTAEACDDGNLTGGDGCSEACEVEGSFCGDDHRDSDEECDHGDDNSDEVPDACRLDCSLPSCGDGVTDTGESCDEPTGNSDTEPDTCRTDCEPPTCGDGVADTGESCDGSDLGGQTCATQGLTGGELACHTNEADACTFDLSLCEECGNGLCEPGEDVTLCPADCAIVGAACTDTTDCPDLPDVELDCMELAPMFPTGYCTGMCAPGSPDPCAAGGGECVTLMTLDVCLVPCTVDADCRQADGYTCEPMGNGTYCLGS